MEARWRAKGRGEGFQQVADGECLRPGGVLGNGECKAVLDEVEVGALREGEVELVTEWRADGGVKKWPRRSTCRRPAEAWLARPRLGGHWHRGRRVVA